jgi:translocation and assembly module TamA
MATNAMRLMRGSPGRAEEVLSAEGRIIAVLQLHGYADAIAKPREVVADFADYSLRATYNIAAGPRVLLGPVQLSTKGRTNAAWVAGLAPWTVGQLYAPDQLAGLERRLRETGVFDQISVALAPATQPASTGPRAVLVSLADRAPRTIELGAGYSTSEGAGLDARYVLYNRLRRADTTTFTARLAQIETKLDGEIALPQWRGPQQTLKVGAAVYRENTDAYQESGVGTRIDVTQRYGTSIYRTSYRTFGASLDFTHTRQKTAAAGAVIGEGSNLITLAGLAALAWDASDDPLNPRHGWKVLAQAEPTAITGDGTQLFLKTQAQASGYLPLDAKAETVIAARFKLGAILNGVLPDVPASRRFYAGGGGSVRGYAYQAIGPRLPDNTPQGGVSLAEMSVELRRHVTGPWSAAAFVDFGAVGGNGFPAGKDFSAGAGFGVRYDLGFGPIRADIAFPMRARAGDPKFQLYISIGQSF